MAGVYQLRLATDVRDDLCAPSVRCGEQGEEAGVTDISRLKGFMGVCPRVRDGTRDRLSALRLSSDRRGERREDSAVVSMGFIHTNRGTAGEELALGSFVMTVK